MLNKKRVVLLTTSASLAGLLLAGCATTASTNNSFMTTKTFVSPQLLLPNALIQSKNVYLQVNNVTGQTVNLTQPLAQALQNNGYTVVSSLQNANQVLTVDILQVGKNTMKDVKAAAAAGVGGDVASDHVGLAMLMPGNDLKVLVTNADTQNLTYSLITDVKFSYKTSSNTYQMQSPKVTTASGTTASANFNVSQANWNNYDTRMIAYATSVSMPFNQAAPVLSNNIVDAVITLNGSASIQSNSNQSNS